MQAVRATIDALLHVSRDVLGIRPQNAQISEPAGQSSTYDRFVLWTKS
jgi:hypothetical protein